MPNKFVDKRDLNTVWW